MNLFQTGTKRPGEVVQLNRECRRYDGGDYQHYRERYLQWRMRTNLPTLVSDRPLLVTRYRSLSALLVAPFLVLAFAGTLDLAFLISGISFLTLLSRTLIPAGVVGSLLTVAVCTRDWFAIATGSRVRGVGVWFALGATIVTAIFGWSWVARIGEASNVGGAGTAMSAVGAAVAVLSGLLLADYLDQLTGITPRSQEFEHIQQPDGLHWPESDDEPPRIVNA